MKLARLLTTGQSLVRAAKDVGRYRSTREQLLPRFGKAEAAQPAGKTGRFDFGWAKLRGWLTSGGTDQKFASPQTLLPPAQTVSAAWPNRRSITEVRVIRNDLADSDVEVVLEPAALKPAPAPAEVSAAAPAGKGLVWNRATARLFAASREQIRA
jgi:hypothetical protein